jgi:hypothetical protein
VTITLLGVVLCFCFVFSGALLYLIYLLYFHRLAYTESHQDDGQHRVVDCTYVHMYIGRGDPGFECEISRLQSDSLPIATMFPWPAEKPRVNRCHYFIKFSEEHFHSQAFSKSW